MPHDLPATDLDAVHASLAELPRDYRDHPETQAATNAQYHLLLARLAEGTLDLAQLQQALSDLEAQRLACYEQAHTLVCAIAPGVLYHTSHPGVIALAGTQRALWRMEAAVQQCLGSLSLAQADAVTRALNAEPAAAPEPATPQWYRLMSDGMPHGPLDGIMLLAVADPAAAPTNAMIMFWAALPGGLRGFDNDAAAVSFVADALGLEGANRPCSRPAGLAAVEQAIVDSLNLATAGLLAQNTPDGTAAHQQLHSAALVPPAHAPRHQALHRLLGQREWAGLRSADNRWFSALPPEQRTALTEALADYTDALDAAHAHIQRHLPARTAFVDALLAPVLEREFAAPAGCRVSVRLPKQVVHSQVADARFGYLYYTAQAVASADTEVWPLSRVMLHNVDDSMRQRLRYLEVVAPEGTSATLAAALRAGITPAWVARTATALDAAQAYETALWACYQPAEPARRALLLPVERGLALQRQVATYQGTLGNAASGLLARALTGPDDGIALYAVALRLFDAQRFPSGSSLAGITLVVERSTGHAVLYLPQAPAHPLSAHDSADQALERLSNWCLQPAWRDYVAGRALEGDRLGLAEKIDQAQAEGFAALFEARSAWPATVSLAQVQLNAHMGLLIRQHREDANSAVDLTLQEAALSRQKVLFWTYVALGATPIVGTVINVIDASMGVYRATREFQAGASAAGLFELQFALAALVGGALEFAPGAGVASTLAHKGWRKVRALRQWRALRQHPSSGRLAHEGRAFRGYQTEVDLAAAKPGQGHLEGTLVLAGEHYIVREGLNYPVVWDEAYHTWRLRPPASSTYAQPIALGADGQWHTHAALYGQLVRGGLQGGGNVLRPVAERTRGYWPEWLRRYLPRAVLREVEDQHQQFWRLKEQVSQARTQLLALRRRQHARPEMAETSALGEAAQNMARDADEMRGLFRGMSNAAQRQFTANPVFTLDAINISSLEAHYGHAVALLRYHRNVSTQITALADDLQRRKAALLELITQAQQTGGGDTAVVQRLQQAVIEGATELMAAHKAGRPNLVRELTILDELAEVLPRLIEARRRMPLDHVSRFINNGPYQTHYQSFRDILLAVDDILKVHSTQWLDSYTITNLTNLLVLDTASDAWVRARGYHLQAYRPLERSLDNYRALAYSQATRREAALVVQQLLDDIEHFTSALAALMALYPEAIDLRIAQRMRDNLERLRQKASATLAVPPAPRPGRQATVYRPFQDSDGNWLIGRRDGQDFVVERLNDTEVRWQPGPAPRRYRPQQALPTEQEPLVPPRPAATVREQARRALNQAQDAETRADRLSRASTATGIELQDTLAVQASALEAAARSLDTLTGVEDRALAATLRRRAAELRDYGRHLRLQLSTRPEAPSASALGWLLDQQLMQVRRVGRRRALAGADFLQEYAVLDPQHAGTGASVLWYVHVHYRDATGPLLDFSKAHIKTVEQRLLGLAWQQQLGDQAPRILRADLGLAWMTRYELHFTQARPL